MQPPRDRGRRRSLRSRPQRFRSRLLSLSALSASFLAVDDWDHKPALDELPARLLHELREGAFGLAPTDRHLRHQILKRPVAVALEQHLERPRVDPRIQADSRKESEDRRPYGVLAGPVLERLIDP